MPLLPCGGERAPRATRRQCRRKCDGLSRHEAAEISSVTLLQRGRRWRWRSYARLSIVPCGVSACAPTHDRTVDGEAGHLEGWPGLFGPSCLVAIRAHVRHTPTPDLPTPQQRRTGG